MTGNAHQTLENFYKRWNIQLNENEKFIQFKNRTLNAISTILEYGFCQQRSLRNEYLDLIGQPIEHADTTGSSSGWIRMFCSTQVYITLHNEQIYYKYVYYLERLFQMTQVSKKDKDNLLKAFDDIIKDSGIPINITKTAENVLLYPSGVKLLDEKLVNDNLTWLQDYPEVYKHFESALQLYQTNKFGRNLLDNLRFCVEQMLKTILGNNSPIEKQKENLGQFLEKKGINPEIRNMVTTLISYFINYQNEAVKHNEKYNIQEIEFIIYLTGTFIRLLITNR